jgi:hypothetical protein
MRNIFNWGQKMEKEIEINGIKYVPKSTQKVKAKSKEGMEYCIIRTYSAGVFAGWINRKFKGKEATIFDSRRIWYWEGACSLSQLANDGTKKPGNCKFSQVVSETDLKDIIEVIPCSENAKECIEGVKIWER